MVSEAVITSLLASTIYDMLKYSLTLSGHNLKKRLTDWLIDESTLAALETQISNLRLNKEMSESAIERHLLESEEAMEIIRRIKPSNTTTIVQTHSGTGDNVAGNKITTR